MHCGALTVARTMKIRDLFYQRRRDRHTLVFASDSRPETFLNTLLSSPVLGSLC